MLVIVSGLEAQPKQSKDPLSTHRTPALLGILYPPCYPEQSE
jgi:hypothetical protein